MSEKTETAAEIEAAERMDWQQVVLNGGPPCFYLEGDGRFCGRAELWEGHGEMHGFVSLQALLGTAIDAAVARERERATVFENAYRELMDKHEQVSRELEARQAELATAEAKLQTRQHVDATPLKHKAFGIMQHEGDVQDGWTVGHWSMSVDEIRQALLAHPMHIVLPVVRLEDAAVEVAAAEAKGREAERAATLEEISRLMDTHALDGGRGAAQVALHCLGTWIHARKDKEQNEHTAESLL